MATVLNRATGELRESVNTPDYPEGDWVIFDRARKDEIDSVKAIPAEYRKVNVDDAVTEMSAGEKAVVDAAAAAARKISVTFYNDVKLSNGDTVQSSEETFPYLSDVSDASLDEDAVKLGLSKWVKNS